LLTFKSIDADIANGSDSTANTSVPAEFAGFPAVEQLLAMVDSIGHNEPSEHKPKAQKAMEIAKKIARRCIILLNINNSRDKTQNNSFTYEQIILCRTAEDAIPKLTQ
jgi:hypothetical protein